jgi:hypothetical protein
MKAINDFNFEYKNGYYLIQEKRTTEEGREYWTPRKTYPTKSKAKASIVQYGLNSEEIDTVYQKSFLKACQKKDKPEHLRKEV